MARQKNPPKLRPKQPGYVGHGHPPDHGKIRPGETRNPWGCKGKPKEDESADYADEMREALSRPIQSKDGQTFTQAEFVINSLRKAAISGSVSAAKFLVELGEKYSARVAQMAEHDESDDSILERHRREILLGAGLELDDSTNGATNSSAEEGEEFDTGIEVEDV